MFFSAAKYELQEGDVVHMPFSKEEHRVAENRRSEAKTSEEWAQKLSEYYLTFLFFSLSSSF